MIGQLSKTAVFIALAVALGWLLAAVPNVEAISAICFFSGYLLGPGPGAIIGAVSMLLFSGLNPLGPPLPPVFVAQVVMMAVIGVSGHAWRRIIIRMGKPEVLAAGFGAVLTFLYGVLADYGFAVSMGRWREPLPVIVAGIPFSVVHIVSNAVIFGSVSAFIVRKYKPKPEEG
jgi:uncharacterized membrane protein